MIKTCKDCGGQVGNDRTTGKYWCPQCKEVKEDFFLKYKIALLNKYTGMKKGANTFLKALGRGLKRLGHHIVEINQDEFYEFIHRYDVEDSFRYKKKIPLQFIYYYHSPDFIIVEQVYNRFDISGVKCPVIYQHREYTHFPDIEKPDILFGSYPFRLNMFEMYHPHSYSKIKYRDYNLVAVDPKLFPPVEKKVIEGVSYIGWSAPPEHFADANGIVAKMVIEDQIRFRDECRDKGYIKFHKGGQGYRFYIDTLGKCEMIVIDGGYINCFGRTLLEAMASKTLCVIRVHHADAKKFYEDMGLTEEMCHFVYKPEDIKNCRYSKNKVEKAYEWVIKNHTYDVRAKETIEKFEEFQQGVEKMPYFMGYAKHFSFTPNDEGSIEVKRLQR